MLTEMISLLVDALKKSDEAAQERAYRNLERVGVDRYTAYIVAEEIIMGNETEV